MNIDLTYNEMKYAERFCLNELTVLKATESERKRNQLAENQFLFYEQSRKIPLFEHIAQEREKKSKKRSVTILHHLQ